MEKCQKGILILSLVKPAFEPVTNLLSPSIVLISDDFPELGFPMNEILISHLLWHNIFFECQKHELKKEVSYEKMYQF